MKPIDLPPDNLFDYLCVDLRRATEVREYISPPSEENHEDQPHTIEGPPPLDRALHVPPTQQLLAVQRRWWDEAERASRAAHNALASANGRRVL